LARAEGAAIVLIAPRLVMVGIAFNAFVGATGAALITGPAVVPTVSGATDVCPAAEPAARDKARTKRGFGRDLMYLIIVIIRDSARS
jgi:hypothetical protein